MSACGLFVALSQMLAGLSILSSFITLLTAVLIALLAFKAMNAARHHRLSEYQQWAMRLFLVVSGYWIVTAISIASQVPQVTFLNDTANVGGVLDSSVTMNFGASTLETLGGLVCGLLMLAGYNLYLKFRRSL
jgi:hypothetical protein